MTRIDRRLEDAVTVLRRLLEDAAAVPRPGASR